jgi:hypothetical protein
MAVSHVFSNAVSNWTGTVTVFNSQGSSVTVAASALVRPQDWNSAHNQFWTLTGNTTGNSTASGTNIVLSGGSNIQLSGSSDSVAIHAIPPTLQFYDNLIPGASSTQVLSNGGLHVFPFQPAGEVMPGNLSALSVFLNVTGSPTTGSAFTCSLSIGFYTSSNSTRVDLVFSASTSWGTGAATASISNSFSGWRWLTFASSQFNAAPNFSAGVRYWAALWTRSSSGGASNFSFFGMNHAMATTRSGMLGANSNSNTTLGWVRFQGVYSVSFATGMPSSLGASDINKIQASASFVPHIILNNVGSNIV